MSDVKTALRRRLGRAVNHGVSQGVSRKVDTLTRMEFELPEPHDPLEKDALNQSVERLVISWMEKPR
jgi:hypothetical protein